MQQREKTAQELASEAGRALVRKRWDKATPEQRKAQGEALAAGRRRARASRESTDRDARE